jgi:iron complex outermembrane receptor protein
MLRCLALAFVLWAYAFAAHAQEFGARAVRERRVAALQAEDATAAGTALSIEGRVVEPRSLSDVIREAPGTRVTSTGGLGAYSAVSLRGADFDETQVVLDEIPLVGPDGGAFDLSLFPAGLFERVEVYRGGAPVWLGSGAIGGVLRLVPTHAQRTAANVGAGAGSFGTFELSGGAQVQGDQGPNVRTQLIVRHTDGDFPYFDDNGTRFDASDDRERKRRNAQLSDASGVLDLSVPLRLGSLHVVALGVSRTGGFPGPGSRPTPAIRRAATRALFGASYSREKKDDLGLVHRMQMVAAFSESEARYTDVFAQFGTTFPSATHDFGQRVFARAALTQRIVRVLEATLLTSYAFDRYDPYNRFVYPAAVPSHRHSVAGAFELRLHGSLLGMRCELRPSVRLEWSETEIHAQRNLSGPFDNERTVLAPTERIGAVLEPVRGLALAASVATGVRLPTIFELFGDRGLTVPSPELKPARSRGVDGGIVVQRQLGYLHVQGEARAFLQQRDSAIAAFRTAQLQVAHENLPRVAQWGMESGLGLRVPRAALLGSFTWLDTEDKLGKRLPFRSKYVAYARPEVHADIRSSWLSHASAFGELSYRSFAFTDRANLAYVPPCLKGTLGMTFSLFKSRLSISARMDDVANARCMDVHGYPLPGRSVFFGIGFQEARDEDSSAT